MLMTACVEDRGFRDDRRSDDRNRRDAPHPSIIFMDGALGYQRTPDHEHLRIAARQGDAVVAENYKDVERLTDQLMERGLPHAGVISDSPFDQER
jgi:hypothetical protein